MARSSSGRRRDLRALVAVRGGPRAGRRARSLHDGAGRALPVVIVRGRDDELRGFVNVCRHRGHLVAQDTGCRETLQCPYHAWTYELDGSLRRAPRSEREPSFDPAAYSLLPVAVDTWGPFVFVNPRAGAPPLSDVLADLPALVGECGLDLSSLRFHSHHEWPTKVNWKVAIENYLECYHCAVAHPGFSKLIDVRPDSYRLVRAPHLHEPDRTGPSVGAGREHEGSVRAARRGDAVPVPPPLAEHDDQHRARSPERLHRAVGADRAAVDGRGDGLLLRRERERRADRGGARVRHPGRASRTSHWSSLSRRGSTPGPCRRAA